MINQLAKSGRLRNVATRLRTKSGDIKTTMYSAEKVQFDGQTCILAVSQDIPQNEPRNNN